MRIIIGMALGVAMAAAPAGFEIWKSAQLRSMGRELAAKGGKANMRQLGSFGNHSLMMAQRAANGEAELHETQNDIFIVQSGEGTLVVGGAVVNGKTTAPHEIRGPSIKGGATRPLAAGDIVHIPAKVPHQVLVESGRQIVYTIVKVDVK